MNLEITNRIIENKFYNQEIEKLKILEKDRIFCCHGIEHSLDVARIAVILCIEKNVKINPDIIYSTALLHDIGRSLEYTENIPHHSAGIKIAEKILDDISCHENMKNLILSLIKNHRNPDNPADSPEYIFYTADKKSRLCFACSAKDKCFWSADKKNMKIEV